MTCRAGHSCQDGTNDPVVCGKFQAFCVSRTSLNMQQKAKREEQLQLQQLLTTDRESSSHNLFPASINPWPEMRDTQR